MRLTSPLAKRPAATVIAWVATIVTACIHNPPAIDGKPSAPRAPDTVWTPPTQAIVRDSIPRVEIPSDLADRIQRLTLPDVIEFALRNNPATRASYATARAAGDVVGAARGAYYPQITLNANAQRTRSISAGASNARTQPGGGTGGSTGGTIPVNLGTDRTFFTPNVAVSWLLFDFGGRAGAVENAEAAAFAASYTHNATVQTVVLVAESAYFNYNAAKALASAQRATVIEDSTNYVAAQARHQAGVATIADVVQAKTALAQAELTSESDEGNVQTARGALAVALGLPATVPYDIQAEPPDVPIGGAVEAIDSLITRAIRARPDLAASRAQVLEAEAAVRQARSTGLPTLSLTGSGGRTFSDNTAFNGNTYTVGLSFGFPLFTGFTNSYNVVAARERVTAARATADQLRDQVIFQVFASYYALQTATLQVRTSEALLVSAQTAEDVASGQYKAGVGTILNVLTAQSALEAARAQQVQARWAWYTSLAQLSHNVGVLGLHGETPIRLRTDTTVGPAPPSGQSPP